MLKAQNEQRRTDQQTEEEFRKLLERLAERWKAKYPLDGIDPRDLCDPDADDPTRTRTRTGGEKTSGSD